MKTTLKKGLSMALAIAIIFTVFNLNALPTLAQEITQEVYLSDLNWKEVHPYSQDDWAQPKKDLNCENQPIRMIGTDGAAVPYSKGIGLHAVGTVVYELKGNYTKFMADVGTDYTNKDKKKPTSIHCSVYVDDETEPRWASSAPITIHTALQPIEVDVTGAAKLRIVVDDAGDGGDSDWGIWGNARLQVKQLTPKEKLAQAIAEAEQLNQTDYTAESWAVFADALANANTVAAGDDEAACTAAETRLRDSINLLQKASGSSQSRYLSDLTWKSANTSLGKLPVKDANINYTPINIYGTVYEKGIGTHAGHEIVYTLQGAYESFSAIVAPDNGCNAEPNRNMSIMGLVVYADNLQIYRNDHINFHNKDLIDLQLDVKGVQELKFAVTQGDNGNDWSDDLDLADAKLYYKSANLSSIKINGEHLAEFLPSVYNYEVSAEKYPDIPVVSVEAAEGAQVQITQATSESNEAVINIGDKTYVIRFTDSAQFKSFQVRLPDNQLLKGTGIIHANDIYVTVPENTDRSAIAPVFSAGKWNTVTVNGVPQQSGETVNNFTQPIVYQVSGATGSRSYTVHIGTWRDIPTAFADENAGVLERPSIVNYPGTLTMKLVMAVPQKGSQTGSIVSARFDDALDIIRQVDNVTRKVPKIVYLVGWQYQGHDDKYPAWGQVNQHLKCTSCNHATSLDCLKWLMDEAYEKYNTRVSLHINSTDAYKDSPLWQTYVDNDLISKTIFGTLKSIGTWEGETAYQVNYKNEWEKGFYKQRVDNLINMLDGRLQRAGSIHSDAFFCRSSKQSNVRTEQEARIRMIRYWRDCGIDLTTEFLHDGNENNAGGDGSGLLGVLPMTWHFNQSIQSYMTRPASMVTGGGINDIKYGGDKETVEISFGRSMWGEDLLTQREVYGLTRPNWDKDFKFQFCTQTLPWTYQNTFDRLTLQNNVVTYSDGLVANANNRTVTRNNKLIRTQDDIFVPATWAQNEVIAYSVNGYTNKTWQFQKEFQAQTVDIYSVNKTGTALLSSDVDVSDGTITLSLAAGEMVSIVPSGSMQ